jgi:hypothetical protein
VELICATDRRRRAQIHADRRRLFGDGQNSRAATCRARPLCFGSLKTSVRTMTTGSVTNQPECASRDSCVDTRETRIGSMSPDRRVSHLWHQSTLPSHQFHETSIVMTAMTIAIGETSFGVGRTTIAISWMANDFVPPSRVLAETAIPFGDDGQSGDGTQWSDASIQCRLPRTAFVPRLTRCPHDRFLGGDSRHCHRCCSRDGGPGWTEDSFVRHSARSSCIVRHRAPGHHLIQSANALSDTRHHPAYHYCSVSEFIITRADSLLGALVAGHNFPLELEQRNAWSEQFAILRRSVVGVEGMLFFEFEVPRLGSRIDAVLVSGPAIIPIEFKCGEQRFLQSDYNQAWDYGLDLKNFHRGSHDASIFPLLVATEAPQSDAEWEPAHPDGVRPPRRVNANDLGHVLRETLAEVKGTPIDSDEWARSPYHPTPTIVEAARALYTRHSVDAISRHDAEAKNLQATSAAVEEIIESARLDRHKAIVFVTGVPGAGKTLVGLNIATERRELGDARGVFLSGNGPLVAVLREALIRDELSRATKRTRRGDVASAVKPFIQNVHHFRDAGLRDPSTAPFEHVVIFDEAQRAWNLAKTADFMKKRKNRANFDQSEPEFLVSYMDRHDGWSVVVCLVGGGQEINTGEAGISAWFEALQHSFPDWHIHFSPELARTESAVVSLLESSSATRSHQDDRLHLTSSMRSFRTEKVSAFVEALLNLDDDSAHALSESIMARYPMAVTRDLSRAKQWIRERARGSERFGIVVSSQAQRLKVHAIDTRVKVDPIHWFLNDRTDTRSSYYLEDAATEFQIQGLELDWICVGWDADLRLKNGNWNCHAFRGDRWINVKNADRRRYLLNTYRVLLTRARQGMVVFVPPGDASDPTRSPGYYDATFNYLRRLGLPEA